MVKLKRTKGDIIFDTLNYTFMILLSLIFIYPFWQTLVISLSTPSFATSLAPKIFPPEITFFSYKEVFKNEIIYLGFMNTLFRTIVGTFLTVLVTFCAAYALSKERLPFRNGITMLIIFTMFFSGGLVPSYLLIQKLGLTESRWALILPVMTSAWNIIIARNFIMTIPSSLEESAMIDGANPIKITFLIMLPLSAPIIAVLTLWSAVAHWNAWFDALIYVRERNKLVLQLILRRLLIEESNEILGEALMTRTDQNSTPETVKAATIIVTILPIVVVYPFLQKYFTKGMLVGSLKG